MDFDRAPSFTSVAPRTGSQISDQLMDTSLSSINQQAPSIGSMLGCRGNSQPTGSWSSYNWPPSYGDVAPRDNSLTTTGGRGDSQLAGGSSGYNSPPSYGDLAHRDKSNTRGGLKKGLWSAEEDQKLISYIKKYGIWNWSQMPKYAGLSRSGKSCRLRWINYLQPNLKRGGFSKEEEESILHFHSILGNKWSAIASKLPGKTDNDVKNHWHSHLKKRAGEQNRLRKTTEQNDENSSPPFENNNMQQPAESNFSFEHDVVSSSCGTTTSKDPGVEFRDDSRSSGTFDDDL